MHAPAGTDAFDAFDALYGGPLAGVVTWEQLSALWARIDPDAGWYLYALGEAPPAQPANGDAVRRFIDEIDALLRREHREAYCGIVYADDLADPRLIKIYDPNHLGVSCGSSKNPPLPGWIMSRAAPRRIQPHGATPAGRRRWWQALFAATPKG